MVKQATKMSMLTCTVFVCDMFVDQFDHFVVHDVKGLNFFSVVVQQGVKSGRRRDGLDLTVVALLPVLAPEVVQHHFGERPSTGIFWDFVGFEFDPFFVQVVLDVALTFVGIIPHPFGR